MILAVAIAAMLIATGGLLIYKDSLTRSGFSQSDLRTPVVVYDSSVKVWNPVPTTTNEPSKSISMTWVMTPIYAGYGGTVNLTLTNDGPTVIHISGYGLEWIVSGIKTTRNENLNLTPGSSANLGLLFFDAPDTVGSYSYRLLLDLAVKVWSGTSWHDFGMIEGSTKQADIIPSLSYHNYTTTKNQASYFDKIKGLSGGSEVSSLANTIKGGQSYNIQLICDAFDWVVNNIAYKDDPSDYWQSCAETLSWRTGDCEDQAILIASIITDMGGNARVNIVEGHAFPTVFVGTNSTSVYAIDSAVESHYGTSLPVYYIHDSMGYWMVIDTTGFPYAGGLPTTAGPVLDGGANAWSFESTNFLIAIDVMF
ncbi:MAG: hypothetical protein A4E32_00909 [Methanomassiliicoccales archaeon PtaU1.Bin124]|nr:MAG: hypothetical protein A4E32_00909 [Methanomassiliicoccales archaeon PtaU1.Bin124]